MDGYLKTTAGGCLLSAVARDANNQMFPAGYAIARVENTQSWFINLIVEAIEIENVCGLTHLIDRQKVTIMGED